MTYHKHVDGLRCLAVVVVFLMHLNVPGFSGGFVGVDVFFVISGFLISGLVMEELERSSQFGFLSFYCRRVLRIFPALLFTVLIAFFAAIVCLNQGAFQSFGQSVVATVFAASNIFFYHQAGYFDLFSQTSPLLHTWSLGVEEQLYFVWPLALFGVYCLWRSKKRFGFMAFFVLVGLISLAANMVEQHHDVDRLYYCTFYRVFEFCVGAVLVRFMKHSKQPNKLLLECLAGLGVVMIALSVFVYQSGMIFPSYYGLLPTLGAALLIYAGSGKYVGAVFRWRPIRHVGLISYSLYLIHWPLIVYSKMVRYDLSYGYSLTPWLKVLLVAVALLIAHGMYRWVEQPFRRRMPRFKPEKIKLLVLALCVALPVAALGFSTRYMWPWQWRLAELGTQGDIKS